MYEETTTTRYTTRAEYVPAYESASFNPNLDLDYLRTLPGMLKCLAIALDFLCFLCVLVGGPGYYAGVGWATFVSVVGFVISLVLLVLYLFHVVDTLDNIPWIVAEMIYCFSWTIFYFIAGSVLAVASVSFHGAFGWAVAAFFSFCAMCVYALDCYLKFLAWKNNEKARGGGVAYRPRQENI
ncbi:synaptophysin/synaptoporin family protein [Aphelenchoides avenae]|nr:synaptophysin/synaptoporin family protein [Aphelenchus avenae]